LANGDRWGLEKTMIDLRKLAQATAICIVLLLTVIIADQNFVLAFAQPSHLRSSAFQLTVDPTALVIKVGQSENTTLVLANSGPTGDQVCFGQQGFPDSGFVLTFLPQCTLLTSGFMRASLIVEATPAAAPQSFTATILAITGNRTAQAPLAITVVPGIPPWVPWLIIVVFVLGLGLAVLLPSKISRKARNSTKPKGARKHQPG
jgi:hypothetical protein